MKRWFKCWNCKRWELETGTSIEGYGERYEWFIFGSTVDNCNGCDKARRYDQQNNCMDEYSEEYVRQRFTYVEHEVGTLDGMGVAEEYGQLKELLRED